jgi:hypothetical protein
LILVVDCFQMRKRAAAGGPRAELSFGCSMMASICCESSKPGELGDAPENGGGGVGIGDWSRRRLRVLDNKFVRLEGSFAGEKKGDGRGGLWAYIGRIT